MVRKCRRVAEITVMEVAQVGVGTRARPRSIAMEETNASRIKRRRLNSRELRISSISSISSTYIQLRSRKIIIRSSISPSDTSLRDIPVIEDQCLRSSVDRDSGGVLMSCYSSNGSGSLNVEMEEGNELVDPEDDNVEAETSTYYCCRERREHTPSSKLREDSDAMDSTAKQPSSLPRQISNPMKIPSKEDIDEFFSSIETANQKHYTDKYNFDFINEKPLEGRYEWVRLKP